MKNKFNLQSKNAAQLVRLARKYPSLAKQCQDEINNRASVGEKLNQLKTLAKYIKEEAKKSYSAETTSSVEIELKSNQST